LLFKHQVTLQLNPTEMVVLLNVLMHWWYRHQKPFPRPTTIARRMGSTVRTVQRSINKLVAEGLLVRTVGENNRPELDPEPLVTRLCDLAKNDTNYLIRTRALAA
jgi:DNA-binding MarR family transcriptional regulator